MEATLDANVIPRHVERLRDPSDGQVLTHESWERPSKPTAGDRRPAAAPQASCPVAAHGHSSSTGSDATSPPTSSAATRKVSCARRRTTLSRTTPSAPQRGSTEQTRRPGTPIERSPVRRAGRRPPTRDHRAGRTRPSNSSRRNRRTRSRSFTGRCRNLHRGRELEHPTERPHGAGQGATYTLVREEPGISSELLRGFRSNRKSIQVLTMPASPAHLALKRVKVECAGINC